MGIVVSTVHGAIKFHTPNGIGTIFSEHNSQRLMEEEGNSTNNGQGDAKDILSCIDIEEKIVIDDEYPEQKTWVSNPISVKKDDGKWKLRIDFTNIIKACISEPHPLPATELGAEKLHKYRLKYFLDAYKGYHQIPMAEKDEEKIAFFTREGVFCYRRLPFGLKNAGATYQRLIDKVFGSQIGRNMEVNADDMVIKSDSEEEMLSDIEETLGRLRGRPLQEKALPFMITLKSCTSGKMVQWTTEANEAFRTMKECLESLPKMVIPTKGETLTVYLAALKRNVSAILMADRGKKQAPVYFVSQTLHEVEQKYPELEKLILALVYATRRLQRYF
ncbi:reverse transcriptase domain-containing protein [Tanacetum coccineum]